MGHGFSPARVTIFVMVVRRFAEESRVSVTTYPSPGVATPGAATVWAASRTVRNSGKSGVTRVPVFGLRTMKRD
ncbi:MAG: hypothetical protein RIC11_10135 [Botrimarina sp.]